MSSSLKEANKLDAKKYEYEFSAFKPIEPQQEAKGLNPDAIKDQENPFSSLVAQNAEILAMEGNPLSFQNRPLPLQEIPEEILGQGMDLSSPSLKLRKAYQEGLDSQEMAPTLYVEDFFISTEEEGLSAQNIPLPFPIPPPRKDPWNNPVCDTPNPPKPSKPLQEMGWQERKAYFESVVSYLISLQAWLRSEAEDWDKVANTPPPGGGGGGGGGRAPLMLSVDEGFSIQNTSTDARFIAAALRNYANDLNSAIDTYTRAAAAEGPPYADPFFGFMPIIIDLKKLKFMAGKPISLGESASMAKMLAAILSQLAAIIGLASKGRSDNQRNMMHYNTRVSEGFVKSSATALKELEEQLDLAARTALANKIFGAIAAAIVTIIAVVSGQFYLATISAVLLGLTASDTMDKIVDKLATALIENEGFSEERARLAASLIVTAAVVVISIAPSAATSLPAAAQAIGKATTALGQGIKQAMLYMKDLVLRAFNSTIQNTAQATARTGAQAATSAAATTSSTVATTATEQTVRQGMRNILERFAKDLYKDVFKNTQGVRIGIIAGLETLSSTGFIATLAPYLEDIDSEIGETLILFLLQLLLMIAEMMAGSGLSSSAKSFNLMRGLSTVQAAAQMGQSSVSLANMKIQTDLAHVEQEFSFYQAMSQFFEKMSGRTNSAFQSDAQHDSNTIKALLEGINRFLEDRNKAQGALVEATLRG